jgi:hypothetical protein
MSILSIVPMFLGVVGGVLCYRAYMKSLELLAARQKNVVARMHKQRLEARDQYLTQEALRHVDNQSDSEYKSLR